LEHIPGMESYRNNRIENFGLVEYGLIE